MGLEFYTTRFLLQAKATGARFGRTLTIGRQNFFVTGPQLDKIGREFNFNTAAFRGSAPAADLVYVEPFLRNVLGAEAVESLDVSNYEGATHVHDMNAPLPQSLKGQFDLVLEAGSLEHIFNFPVAIRNLMEALKPGGTLIIQTPANNYFGHGFYQFSAELFYRVLSEANGFKLERMHLLEHFFPCHFFSTPVYSVTDPEKVRKRVQLVNKRPTLLLVHATRTADLPIFAATPQQSDYVPLWKERAGTPPVNVSPTCNRYSLKERIYSLPLRFCASLFAQYVVNKKNKPSLKNKDFFRASLK